MKINKKSQIAITDTLKNAKIALLSISDILPKVDDNSLKKELQSQFQGYQQVEGEISTFMLKHKIQQKDINAFKKTMLKMAIRTNTLFNSSKNKISELMIKGTTTGINELFAMKNESQTLDEEVVELIKKLLVLEEKYQQNLRAFL